ncbi:MAG TPA: neutral/alkaline non-lysosomal ceramidase N-terminal domain-containing protein [Pirellulales bacterium]|nr:neutral/alkaline non-lysosomal ceramidase N-terminal domain-containing protein [Pirellulales bacterium]
MSRSTRRQLLGTLGALPLLASAARAKPKTSSLRAGAATANITLPLGANNGGVIMRGSPATSVHDELHARALVLDDGNCPLAIVVCDLRMIGRELVDRAKSLASAALGWPTANMLVSATHTHSAPGLVDIEQGALDRWYAEMVVVRIADAIRRAASNLQPARIGWASIDKPEHVFNRRYKVRPGGAPPNPFGETTDQVVTNPPRALELLEPAGPVDPQLSVLSVQDIQGRAIAVLANYGLHYIGGLPAHAVSADYFGMFAGRLGELLAPDSPDVPFVGMMSNGASGDVNGVNRLGAPGQRPAADKMAHVANDLASAAARLCREMPYQDSITIDVATRDLQLGIRQPDEARLRWARETLAGADRTKLTRQQVYAEEALTLAAASARVAVPIQAIRIGDLGIAASSCEVFAETGLAIKSQSCLRPTFVVELANGYNGYLPTAAQHALGGYETWPARSACLETSAEAKIRTGLLDLLAALCR